MNTEICTVHVKLSHLVKTDLTITLFIQVLDKYVFLILHADFMSGKGRVLLKKYLVFLFAGHNSTFNISYFLIKKYIKYV